MKQNQAEVGPPQPIWGGRARRGVFLPYGPIWFGLLANSAIYGGAWWGLLLGLGKLEGWRRKRAGRCVKCLYDLREIQADACPECGEVISCEGAEPGGGRQQPQSRRPRDR